MKKEIFDRFSTHISRGQIRYLRAGHLDILEGQRKGSGFMEKTTDTRFFDGFSSAGCFNVGRCNKEIIEALCRAADEMDMGTPGLLSGAKIRFAEKLAALCPGHLKRVIPAGSGADAVEAALKLARGATGRPGIISMDKAYHGHSGFSLSANGKPYYKELFEPLMPEFSCAPFGDAIAIEKAVNHNTAAVILEPIQGEGGIHVASDNYLKTLREICDREGALLIFDEIQTGFCRTGKFWASEHSGVVPDIMITAKSIGGGIFPNAAAVAAERPDIIDFLTNQPNFHPSSGGSDLGCITSLKVMELLQRDRIWENADRQGIRFIRGLKQIQSDNKNIIKEVRGRGLMVGLEYKEEFMGVLMADCLINENIFAVYSGNAPQVMRFQLPLTITTDEIDRVLAGIIRAIKQMKIYLLLLKPLVALPWGRYLLYEKDILIRLNIFLRRFGF